MAVKICIDAGHYGKYNRSPAVKEYYESDMTWKLHLLLKKYLEQAGFEVITTRSNKAVDKGLYDRGKTSKGCDLFLSLHSNAAGSAVNETVDRVDIYAPLSGKGHDIARKLADCIVKVMGTKQGGYVKTRRGNSGGEYYGVIRGAVAVGTPGLLVEHSFHTHTRSAQWLLDDNNLDKLAKAEAQVLAEHYGMSANTGNATSKLTEIAGKAKATAAQMQAYIKTKNPSVAQSVLDMIPLYLSEGAAEGIRGDIAFAQSCLETGNFAFKGSAVTLDRNNFCGMGVTANGEKGNSFDTPQLGIRAQIQHLKAYANDKTLKNECIDPRFKYVTRGSAQYVEWLGIQENPNGKGWASGANYGGKILDILHAITGTKASTTETQATVLGKRVLKYVKGEPVMVGEDVREMQTRLNALGYKCGEVDGKYGPETVKGVKAFQTTAKIKVDGEFGTESLKALKAAENTKTTSNTVYTVKQDDTLWSIAADKLGSGNRYKEIMTLNGLTSDVIKKGQKLKIPKK